MPPFQDLRSDYPLFFASFGCPDMGAFQYRLGGQVEFVSWFLTHAVPSYSCDFPDSNVNPHCFRPARRIDLSAQFCPSECNPLRRVVRTSNWARTHCVNRDSTAYSAGASRTEINR